MTFHECSFESDVMDAIVSARWPHRCDVSLQAHVAGCDVCRDLVAVAAPLRADFDEAYALARVPSAEAVWWRARIRARSEAERQAIRPVLVAAACAVTCALALLAGAISLGMPWLRDAFASGSSFQVSLAQALDMGRRVSLVADRSGPHLLAFCVLLVATPVALYFAAREGHRGGG